jgi:proline iminopeptidase
MKLPTVLIFVIILIQLLGCDKTNLLKPEEGFLEVNGGET